MTNVSESFNNAVYLASRETFESGMESSFGQKLDSIHSINPRFIFPEVLRRRSANQLSEDITAEVLVWASRAKIANHLRTEFTCKFLADPSPRVRDAATTALCSIEDRGAVKALERAITNEKVSSLKVNMCEVLSHLQSLT